MIGTRQRFHYPNFGTPDTLPEYTAHSGQMVTVIALVPEHLNETGEPLFSVQADDGWRGTAFQSELGDVAGFRPHDPAHCGCEEVT